MSSSTTVAPPTAPSSPTSHDDGDIRLDPPGIVLPVAALFPAPPAA